MAYATDAPYGAKHRSVKNSPKGEFLNSVLHVTNFIDYQGVEFQLNRVHELSLSSRPGPGD